MRKDLDLWSWSVFVFSLSCSGVQAETDSVPVFQMDLISDLVINEDPLIPGKLNGFRSFTTHKKGWSIGFIDEVTVTHVAWNDFEQDGLSGDAFITVNRREDFPEFERPVISQIIPSGRDTELTKEGWRIVEIEPVTIDPGIYYVFGDSDDETVIIESLHEGPQPIVRDPRIANWSAACGSLDPSLLICGLAPGIDIGPMLFVEPEPPDARIPGDFNNDGILDIVDIDMFDANLRIGDVSPPRMDLNTDNFANTTDRAIWIVDLKKTYFGDANLDGEFNSADLVSVFDIDEYEDGIAWNSSWSEGDWNVNFEFDSSDLVLAFQDGGYEIGPRIASHAVPEPSSIAAIMLTSLLVIVSRTRHRMS